MTTESLRTIATMRLLGGRPCLDLVNTVDARRDRWGPDLLLAHDDLLVWAARLALLDADALREARTAAAAQPRDAAAVFERAKTLREAVADIFGAAVEARPVPATSAAALRAEVDMARRYQSLVPLDGRFGWTWHDEPPLARVLHRVALDAAELVTDTALQGRVRVCTGPNCGWLFLDETRNGSRRWCREEGCGTHVRMLRYRARKR